MENINVNWDASRPVIFKAMLSTEAENCQVCSICQSKTGIVRCAQCLKGQQWLCGDCDVLQHEALPFHDREAFLCGHFQFIPPTTGVTGDGNLITIGKFHKIPEQYGMYSLQI